MKTIIFLLLELGWHMLKAQTSPESISGQCPDFDLCLSASAYAGMGHFTCPHEENITIAWNTTCPDSEDGMLVANVSGGKAPYTYRWSNGGTGERITGLAPGAYTLTVSDAHGCQIIRSTTLKSPPAPQIRLLPVLGPKPRKGARPVEALEVTVEGTSNCYQFQWDDLPATDFTSFPNPKPGPHIVRVTDPNGCVWEERIHLD
jgi:hypothetical protein